MLSSKPLRNSGYLSVRQIGEVQVCLLVLRETKIERASVALMSGVGADYHESAHKRGSLSGGS